MDGLFQPDQVGIKPMHVVLLEREIIQGAVFEEEMLYYR